MKMRKYIFNYRQLGTKENLNEKLFGKRIGAGSNFDVYLSNKNTNKVLKVQYYGYSTKKEMRKAIKQYNKRNKIPMYEKMKYIGYLKDSDNSYYPVFSQKKVTLPSTLSYYDWDNVLLPKLEDVMKKNGINVNNHTYTYKQYNIKDLSPYNVGKDKFGNWKFIDANVFE